MGGVSQLRVKTRQWFITSREPPAMTCKMSIVLKSSLMVIRSSDPAQRIIRETLRLKNTIPCPLPAMNAISQRFYQEVVQRLNQLPIRSNRHKVAVFTLRYTDPSAPLDQRLTEQETEQTVFAFHIMFERNNPESAWRLVTPLKFIDY